ncbi:XrtA-associated ATPase [Aestuariirhabdus sp. Z084]|uniref:XrtA/PEP-CTERM system-associated ATPase n=1 Tax=Aestuariirhabdus haliotis TaxID=2918751 RepID=UPI00201B3D9D|nr:XrtA/PEP-CTERM system-associated ATPase [Aestuariirhabdus haliotis]MCL6414677.1 XrtA-associated ATPase [Aestuariirhabdus haliotis]MCL6418609.1 XrtA-associated ATPase [Aestuariirhabdus haliotis]
MYEKYYGFTSKPFQLSPDPRFYFSSRGHSRAMSYLRYGLGQCDGFIIITGGVGTGKTTLIKMLFSDLDQEQIVAANIVTTNLESDDLMRMVSSAFSLPTEGLTKADLLRQFEAFLLACDSHGRRVLLVIDEAQNLPKSSLEELRMLSNFQVNNRPLLQSFLLGQEEFRDTLQSDGLEQLRQRVIASCHLAALDREETKNYINHRLSFVGWTDNPHIDETAYHAIYEYTEGVPRRVNVFCDRLLLYAYLEELSEISNAVVKAVSEEMSAEITQTTSSKKRGGEVNTELLKKFSEIEEAVENIKFTTESLEAAFASRMGTLKKLILSIDNIAKQKVN